ncbi:MAG: hypothetical protein HPY59_14250 [Anaerolineae bacterium]|nr:hypothetical protein [Anaerolineae bacterium]
MKLTSKPLAAILFAILFGGIAFTSAMNWWQTESTKVPEKFQEGEAAGQYNPADIRGSYTFGDINRSFPVPIEVLKTAFGIPAETPGETFAVKDLETLTSAQTSTEAQEIGTTSVRYFVALYCGLPFEVIGDVYLPRPAVEILKESGKLTADQIAYLEAHTVDISDASSRLEQTVDTPETPSGSEQTVEEQTIKGKTTFQELLDWGVNQSRIEAILGGPMPSASTPIREYCAANGLEFSTVKTALQTEIDQLQK